MNRLIRFATLLACLGSSATALAQPYDELPVPVYSTRCRAIIGQAEIDGVAHQIVGRACQQSDGTWQFVQNPDGSVLWYPVDAYPYPDPWYWGPTVFVGVGATFIFVDRFHHFHHFDRFRPVDRPRFGAPMGMGFHHAPFPAGGMHGFGGMRRH
ncbi:Surface antigen [Paraburkholderia sacchari]|uniref:hypothetical protein n=1 Tax=Paraburkholderia sacchari TaxID=159450 RepID=UPI0039A58B1C